MGGKHSHEAPKQRKTTTSNNNNGKPAVLTDDGIAPLFPPDFDINVKNRPKMPDRVSHPELPPNPPPPRQPAISKKVEEVAPPVPPRGRSLPLNSSPSFPSLPPKPGHGSNSSLPTIPKSPIPSNVQSKVHKCHHLQDDHPLYIAEHRFIPEDKGEISVEIGDQLYVLNNTDYGDWWYVKTKNEKRGFVPRSHLKRAEIKEPWFAGNIPRIVAEERVMQHGLPKGAFLIRENNTRGNLVLTVKQQDDQLPVTYNIYRQKNDKGFEMRNDRGAVAISFVSLQQLVHHFQSGPHSLICTKLSQPAPVIKQAEEYVTMKKWQIDRKNVQLMEQIGKGQFGEVYRGRLKHIDVAVKKMKTGIVDETAYEQFLGEGKLHTNLDHPNVVRLLAVCTIQKPYWIITEYMKNGSLLSFLQKGLSANKLSSAGAMNIAAQVASGMSYLTANNCIHRDLAARNVLVGDISSNNIPSVKVADFGLARQLNDGVNDYTMLTDVPMAVRWMAPEAFEKNIFNSKTDVWSYGILLWEIGSLGQTPYREWSMEKMFDELKSGFHLPKPELVPDYVYEDAFLRCVDINPNKRLTFDQLFRYFDESIVSN